MPTKRPISPRLARARDLTQKIIHKRDALQDVQKCLGTSFEKSGDFELAQRLAHELGGLLQEMELVAYILNAKSAASGIQTTDTPK